MAIAAVDRARLQDAVETVAGRVAATVRPLTETRLPTPRSAWTVGETAAHLASAQQAFSRIACGEIVVHGDGTPAGLAAANADLLLRFTERDGARLADLILDGTRSYFETVKALPAGFTARPPMGTMDIDTCTSYMLTHLMTHGWPMARALNQPVPFEPAHVELTLPFITWGMPLVLDREAVAGFTACYEVHFRDGPSLAFMFDDGELTIASAPTRPVDCHLAADPVAFFLVGTRLVGQWGQIARGKLVTWGRKPWLALRFVGLFNPP